MIDMITFREDHYYGGTPQEELMKWSKGIKKEDVISVTRNEDRSITVIYWV